MGQPYHDSTHPPLTMDSQPGQSAKGGGSKLKANSPGMGPQPAFTLCANLGKWFYLSEPQFPHVEVILLTHPLPGNTCPGDTCLSVTYQRRQVRVSS